jgi:alkanesulfonate monooxygenase SsuD/methylene tetrahydromethanopterin reductase-like flavin-dependent oxidoreductase (luciferase family)
MRLGLTLHPDRGIDAVFEEARQADQQGFDSIWLSDHLMSTDGELSPNRPYDTFTLATGLGAVTSRIRVTWAMLNVGFRPPTLLAKMLTTLDQITHGRVIAGVGSGWFKEEYGAYNLRLIDDHDERVEYAREAVQLFKELWTHPAPELVSFEGRHVQTHELPFAPAPYQKPHPPIWFGGDSDATLSLIKEYCDGWVMSRSDLARAAEVTGAPDWPTRPMTVVRTFPMFVQQSHQAAEDEAIRAFEARAIRSRVSDVSTYLATAVIGNPDECQEQLAAIEAMGVNYVRVNCADAAHQERIARHILPRLNGVHS